jgi:hypothetical protein
MATTRYASASRLEPSRRVVNPTLLVRLRSRLGRSDSNSAAPSLEPCNKCVLILGAIRSASSTGLKWEFIATAACPMSRPG